MRSTALLRPGGGGGDGKTGSAREPEIEILNYRLTKQTQRQQRGSAAGQTRRRARRAAMSSNNRPGGWAASDQSASTSVPTPAATVFPVLANTIRWAVKSLWGGGDASTHQSLLTTARMCFAGRHPLRRRRRQHTQPAQKYQQSEDEEAEEATPTITSVDVAGQRWVIAPQSNAPMPFLGLSLPFHYLPPGISLPFLDLSSVRIVLREWLLILLAVHAVQLARQAVHRQRRISGGRARFRLPRRCLVLPSPAQKNRPKAAAAATIVRMLARRGPGMTTAFFSLSPVVTQRTSDELVLDNCLLGQEKADVC